MLLQAGKGPATSPQVLEMWPTFAEYILRMYKRLQDAFGTFSGGQAF